VCRKHLPGVAAGFDDPRVRIHVADGARFVPEQPANAYDVVLVDSTDPIGSGKVLFQAPFFRDLQRVLGPTGLLSAQSLSPWLQKREQREMYQELGSVWPHVLAYHATVPTYPGALWTFAFCSDHSVDLTRYDRARAKEIAETCRYYTPELQVAAFHLPRFVTENTVQVSQEVRGEREGRQAAKTRRQRSTGDKPHASS
jgi:spermidine synthase